MEKQKNETKNEQKIPKKRKRDDTCVCSICQKQLSCQSSLERHQLVHQTERPFECKECKKKFKNDVYLQKHMMTHSDAKEFSCDYKGCGAKFKRAQYLQRHKVKHYGEAIFKCDEVGCEVKFKRRGNLQKHKFRKHQNIRNFKCEQCESAFKTSTELKTHNEGKHGSDQKDFICDFNNCTKSFKNIRYLNHHKRRIHETSERKYDCNVEGCDAKLKSLRTLRYHYKHVHLNERKFVCNLGDCDAKFNTKFQLKEHVNAVHRNLRPFECNTDHCDAKFKAKSALKVHQRAYHSKEGMKRKQVEQQRVRLFLIENDVAFDEELVIKYQDCVTNPDRYYARVDFVIVEVTNCILILECDECSHQGNPTRCEVTRMLQIQESILKRGITLPIVFIRYNPNGNFKLNNKKKRMERIHREQVLLEMIEDIKEGLIKFEKPLNIIYLFYSQENGIPSICSDPEYPEEVLNCVDLANCKV